MTERRGKDMTDHIEDRLLKLAEKVQKGWWTAEQLEEIMAKSDTVYLASLPPEVVAAMCRVVAAGRKVCYTDPTSHRATDWGAYLATFGQRLFELRDAMDRLAAFDAMEEKAE